MKFPKFRRHVKLDFNYYDLATTDGLVDILPTRAAHRTEETYETEIY